MEQGCSVFGVEYKGMAKLTSKKWLEIVRLAELGVPKTKLASEYGVGRTSIYRKLAQVAKKKTPSEQEGASTKRT
jgi:DNA invertase Pin-like site-specific DNA recombinase